MTATPSRLPVLVAGGGIGGLATALALVRQGFRVKVLEQAAELGEIGAGMQLGPNAFHAFDALGVGEQARKRAVYTDYMVMHDAIDEYQVGFIPTGEAFRQRFGNPYAVIHRADAHLSLLEGVQASDRVSFHTGTRVERVEQDADGVTVVDQHGHAHRGVALIGADGVKSVVRQQFVGDAGPGQGGDLGVVVRRRDLDHIATGQPDARQAADQFQRLADILAGPLAGHGQAEVLRKLLQHHRHPLRAPARRAPPQRLAVQLDAAEAGPLEAVGATQQAGLAAAVGAADLHHIATGQS